MIININIKIYIKISIISIVYNIEDAIEYTAKTIEYDADAVDANIQLVIIIN